MFIPQDDNFNGRSSAANNIRAIHAVVKAARAVRATRFTKSDHNRMTKRAREGVEVAVEIAQKDGTGPSGVDDASLLAIENLHKAGPTLPAPLAKDANYTSYTPTPRAGDWSNQPVPRQAMTQGAPAQADSMAQANLPMTQDEQVKAFRSAMDPSKARNFSTGQLVSPTVKE